MSFLKYLNPFRLPSALELKARHLAQAERELAEAEYALEHYEHEVAKLNQRVTRLRGMNKA